MRRSHESIHERVPRAPGTTVSAKGALRGSGSLPQEDAPAAHASGSSAVGGDRHQPAESRAASARHDPHEGSAPRLDLVDASPPAAVVSREAASSTSAVPSFAPSTPAAADSLAASRGRTPSRSAPALDSPSDEIDGLASLPTSHDRKKQIDDEPRPGAQRTVSFDPATKISVMDRDNGIPQSFWRNQSPRTFPRDLSSSRASGVSPGTSFMNASQGTGAVGVLRLQHEDSEGEMREVELEVDLEASSTSADETTAIVTRERGGRRRNYGVANPMDADVESEAEDDEGQAGERDRLQPTRASVLPPQRRQRSNSRSERSIGQSPATRPSRKGSFSARASSTNVAGVDMVRAAVKRAQKNRRDSAQRPTSRSRERASDNWYKRLAEKYGSVELENKGAVARDHLALERTFLAWLRTSLSFASIGIAVTQLFRLNTSIPRREATEGQIRLRHVGKPLGATFIAISILILLVGFHRYFESQYYVIRGKFPASRGSIILVAFTAGALIVTSLVIVLVIAPRAFET